MKFSLVYFLSLMANTYELYFLYSNAKKGCVYAQRESHWKNIRVRGSRDTCAMSLLGVQFSSFLVQDVKRRICRDIDEGFMGCSCC